MRSRNPRDLWAGLIYLTLGVTVVWIGRGYAQGTSARMGPGYFPVVLGALLAFLGALSIARAFVRPGEPISAIAWRPLLLILGATVVFGLLLPGGGLLLALPALIVVSALASRYSRVDAGSIAALIGIVVFCYLVFVRGLGVPMPLLGSWFGT